MIKAFLLETLGHLADFADQMRLILCLLGSDMSAHKNATLEIKVNKFRFTYVKITTF